MFNFLMRKRKNRFFLKDQFLEKTYKEMPGYSVISIEDLRFQAIEFEKLIKNHIIKATGQPPKSRKLHNIIDTELRKQIPEPYDQLLDSEFQERWSIFIEEALLLKEFRNNIIHSDFNKLPEGFEQMPDVSELYNRFKKANEMLSSVRICDGNISRFRPIKWSGNILKIKINDSLYELKIEDLENLLLELNPSSRGKIHFIKGRVVESKVLDYFYEKVTYYIEGYPAFELNNDDSMVLEDLINNLLLKKQFDLL